MQRREYFIILLLVCLCPPLYAHHVLGRPTYNLSENSTTPPSAQIESHIGKYFVTIMAFPAFPEPNTPGRIKLYANRSDGSGTLNVPVTFTVRDDNWFATNQETLGTQTSIENIYNQGFVFSKEGDYLITAVFQTDGEPYQVDFPIKIGHPAPIGTIGIFVGIIFIALISVNILQRRRLPHLQTQRHHDRESQQ